MDFRFVGRMTFICERRIDGPSLVPARTDDPLLTLTRLGTDEHDHEHEQCCSMDY